MSRNMIQRILVAAVGIPAAVGVVYLGGWILAGLLAVLGVVGAAELYRLAARSGMRPLSVAGFAGAAGFPLVTFATRPAGLDLGIAWLVAAIALWLLATMALTTAARRPGDQPLGAVAVTVFGALYAGGLPAFLLVLRHGADGGSRWAATWLVFLPVALVWICDTLAMLGGSTIGGPKLAPVASPNKTWAGAVAGTLGALIAAPLYGMLLLAPVRIEMPWWELVIVGGVVSLVGQVGDVAESLLKREAGVKDSGTFFLGHGGVLDRLDSLYWAIPTATMLLLMFGRI